jgi:hypothetical protein
VHAEKEGIITIAVNELLKISLFVGQSCIQSHSIFTYIVDDAILEDTGGLGFTQVPPGFETQMTYPTYCPILLHDVPSTGFQARI